VILNNVSIRIDDRTKFENRLLKSLSNMPEEEVYREHKNFLGVKKNMKQDALESGKAKNKIIHRRIKFGVHTGRCLVSDWITCELDEDDGGDVLSSSASKIKLDNYIKSDYTAVVCLIEYVVRPGVSSVKSSTETARKEKITTAENYTVVVGSAVYVPYDGRRLRLRNTDNGREGSKKSKSGDNGINLNLLSDSRCRVFSNDHIYNPKADVYDEDDDDGAGGDRNIVSYAMQVFDKNKREERDGTPDRDEDESDVDNEQDDDSGSDAESGLESGNESEMSTVVSLNASDTSSSSESDENNKPDDKKEKNSKKDKKDQKVKKKKRHTSKSKKAKKSRFSDSDSDLENSIVSGDSFSNFLVLRTNPKTGGINPRHSTNSTFRKKRHQKSKHRYSTSDIANLASVQEEDWHGWRQGIHVPRDKTGISGAALTAPIHFNDDYPSYTRTGDYEPSAMRVVSEQNPLSSDMTRAARARLGRHGFFEKVLETYTDVNADDDSDRYNIDTELADTKLRHEITMQFAAFSATEKHAPLPTSVYFTYQLYDKEPTRTERLVLRKSSRKDDDDHSVARVLCREKLGKGENEYSPSRTLKYTFDLSLMGISEAKGFAHYLKDKTLYVDVWDGDALMHIGTIAIPLRKLMRQGRQTSKIARVYDVISPRGMSEEGGALGVRQGAIGGGPVVGKVQMLIANFGETGKAGELVGAGVENEVEIMSGSKPAELNWRANTLSSSMAAASTARPNTPGRARHKVRARPLSESNKDLRKMVKSFGIDGGDLGGTNGRAGLRGGEDMETISYDELMKLCKRFRGAAKGRIDYKNSGLLELLDVPDVNRLEKRLVRLLTLAEERGTSLEETFSYLDADNDRELTADDMEAGLRGLKAFDGMRRDEISILVSRFPRNNDGLISLNEFIGFVRERQPKSAEEDKLRKILKKAEAMGKSVEDIFGFFDKDGTGEITLAEFRDGLSQLGTFSKLSNKEFRNLAKRFDNDGDGKISLFEFMTFMGKKYNPVESATKKLKAILLKAENMGMSLSKAFAEFDTDGSGKITIEEFSQGLDSLGVFKDLSQDQVQEVLKNFDKEGAGVVSLAEFMRFVGRDYVADVEAKLRKILAKAIGMGATIEECFQHFDTDGDGKINAADMQTGMKTLGQFTQVGSAEVQELIRRFDDDNDGSITESEFIGAFGSSEVAKSKNKEELSPVEKKVVELFLQAENSGASLSSLFSSMAGGKPELSFSAFGAALRDLDANFAELTSAETDSLCAKFDLGNTGSISLEEFKVFVRDAGANLKKTKKDGGDESSLMKAEDVIFSLYGVCCKFSGGQKLSDVSGGRESLSFAAWKKALGDLLVAPDFLNNVDMELNEEYCQDMIRNGFKEEDASGSGEISVKLFEARFEARNKGARNIDKQLKGEVVMLCRLVLANALDLGEGDAVGLTEALKIVASADVRLRSKGVNKMFADYTKAGNMDSKKFLEVLSKVMDDVKINCTEGELKSLVKRMEGKRGTTEVDVTGFCEWICKGAQAGQERGGGDEEKDSDSDDEKDNGKENKNGFDDEVENEYKFSTDPDIRDVEKKIRRVARKTVSQGRIDLNELFMRYDPEGKDGTIVRSDFIQILMEVGLSLLDSGGEITADGSNDDPARKRQMAALAAHRGGSGKRASKLRERKPQLFTRQGEERGDAFNDEKEALSLIKWYREGQKKTVVRDMLTQSLTTKFSLCPRFGHTIFFEYELKNPFSTEERFTIDFKDVELRVVTNSEEWMYLRRRVVPAVGTVGEWPIEHDMIDGTAENGYMISLQPNETVSIPFTLLSIDPALKDARDGAGERNVEVNFVSSTYGHTTSVLELSIKPKAMIVDRSFRFFQAEGEILKRTIQLLGETKSLDYHDYETDSNGAGHKYVHCVETSSNRVVVDWRGSAQPGAPQEVLIKYRCGKFPSLGEFYIIIYDDHFQACVHECWHVVVQSRLRLDVNSSVGQSTPSELVIQGDKFARRVQLYSSHPAECDFDPNRNFQLVPGAFNRAACRFKMRSSGQHKVHIHMVDMDTKELVCAWLVTVNTNLPVITKVYDVQLPVGCTCSKKLSFTNQWDKTRRYKLLSSDEEIMRPRNAEVDIDARALGYMRLFFNPIETVGTHEVLLFVNDEFDQNEESFLLKLHVS
jgi:Ca2+-binding EF-hand superfamily protein